MECLKIFRQNTWPKTQQVLVNIYVGEILRLEEVLANFEQYIDKVGTIAGWARTVRAQANNTLVFIELSDGSTQENLQVIFY